MPEYAYVGIGTVSVAALWTAGNATLDKLAGGWRENFGAAACCYRIAGWLMALGDALQYFKRARVEHRGEAVKRVKEGV